jgi:hypothetical protein
MSEFIKTQRLRWNDGDLERLWVSVHHDEDRWGKRRVRDEEWRHDPDYQTLLPMGWLPIDTAPTDIGQVLVWGRSFNCKTGAPWLARFVEGSWQHGPLRIDATHWMPLVPPKPSAP